MALATGAAAVGIATASLHQTERADSEGSGGGDAVCQLRGPPLQGLRALDFFSKSLVLHILYKYIMIMYTSQPQQLFHATTPAGGAALRCHYLGPHPIVQHYLERMNLAGIVQDCLGSGRRGATRDGGITHAQVLAALVHNIIVAPMPLYRIRQWLAGIEAQAIGLDEQNKHLFNDDRIARSLEALCSERGRSIFFRLALRTDRIHFDTTSVTFSGSYHGAQQPRICRGHNKDGRDKAVGVWPQRQQRRRGTAFASCLQWQSERRYAASAQRSGTAAAAFPQ
jgi:hypothetical protein